MSCVDLKHSVQFLSVLVLTDLGQFCVTGLCGLLCWCSTLLVSHKLHMSCVCPYCSRLFVLCHKLHTYFLCQAWAGKEFARGDIHPKILNWETFNPYLDGLIFGKIWKAHWEKFVFYLGKVWNFFVKLWYDFLEKFVVGKIWNWWIWMSIFLKFLLGNPVGNIPAQVSWEILCAMLGVVLKNVPVAKFVWNIGEIFFKKLNLLKISSWEHLVKFWGKFYFGKV